MLAGHPAAVQLSGAADVADLRRPGAAALERPAGTAARPRRSRPTTTQGEVAHAYLEAGEEQGLIEGDERRLLQSIVDFGGTLVREVMTPRPDIVAIQADATVAQLRALFREQEYSRFPVFKENLDNILGVIRVKDLLQLDDADVGRQPMMPLARPATFVPETKRVPELLKEFQRRQVQMAIVVDEYGGTAGLVTIEDLLEEIVGEIRDEDDVESDPIVDEGNGSYVFSAKVSFDELRDRLDLEIESEGFETVGGYVLSRVGRVPAVGETLEVDGMSVEVLEAERRRIHKVRIRKPVAISNPGSRSRSQPRAQRLCFDHRPPNAGKSTLLNRIVGEKIAIVSDKPQTTRTRILGTKNYPDGQIAFVDTPGIHRPLHRMNVRMVDAAIETLREVDAVMLVHDAATRAGHGDQFVSRLLNDVEGAGRARPEQDRSSSRNPACCRSSSRCGSGTTSPTSSPCRPRPAKAWRSSSACCSRSCRKARRCIPPTT